MCAVPYAPATCCVRTVACCGARPSVRLGHKGATAAKGTRVSQYCAVHYGMKVT